MATVEPLLTRFDFGEPPMHLTYMTAKALGSITGVLDAHFALSPPLCHEQKLNWEKSAGHSVIDNFPDGGTLAFTSSEGGETAISFDSADSMLYLRDLGFELRGMDAFLEAAAPRDAKSKKAALALKSVDMEGKPLTDLKLSDPPLVISYHASARWDPIAAALRDAFEAKMPQFESSELKWNPGADEFLIHDFPDGGELIFKRLSGAAATVSFDSAQSMKFLKDLGFELRGLAELKTALRTKAAQVVVNRKATLPGFS